MHRRRIRPYALDRVEPGRELPGQEPDDQRRITNAAKGAPEGQRREAIKTYLDGQPAAKAELEKIRQPLTSLKNSCGADTDDAAPAAPAGLMGQAPAAEQPAVENAPAEQPQQPWNPFAPQQPAPETATANTPQAAPNVAAVVDQQDV